MATLRHAHSSSLYSEPPKSLAAQVDRGVSAEDPSANLMSYTEVGSDKRADVLKDADPEHWAAWVPGQSDVGLMWLKQTWSPVWKEPHMLTSKVWTDGNGRKHETWCATALLEHEAGGTLFYSVAHLPSHVQNGNSFYDNAQAAAWKSACNGWSSYWNNKRQKHKPRAALIVADWNVDFHSDTWRDRVKAYFPSMHLTWQDGTFPAKGKGTHGSRLIDGTMATVKPNDCWLLKDDASSDHRPYGEVLPW